MHDTERVTSRLAAAAALAAACSINPAGDPDADLGKGDDLSSLSACDYAPPIRVGRARWDEARELSGLIASRDQPGVLWALNDGAVARLYALDRTGELLATIDTKVAAADWEDLAIGPGPDTNRDYLYVADTGDNALTRDEVRIVRIAEPKLDAPAPLEIETFELRYDDDRSHDAEAILVDPADGRLYIVTKQTDGEDRRSKLFATRGPLEPGVDVLERLITDKNAPHLDGIWTAADISPSADQIALTHKGGGNVVFTRRFGEPLEETLAGEPCFAASTDDKHESIAFSAAGGGFYMIPEGARPDVTFAVELDCPDFARPRATPLDAPLLVEVSGIAASRRDPGVVWAVNDPGPGRDVVVAVSAGGAQLGAFRPAGAGNVDWEDLAIGPGPGGDAIYIADIGDNDLERAAIAVHRIAEPDLAGADPSAIVDVPVDSFALEYADGEAHDAESLIVDPATGDLYVITRSRKSDDKTRMFAARAPLSTAAINELVEVAAIDAAEAITAADYDGERMILRLHGSGNLIGARHPDAEIGELLSAACVGPGGDADHDAVALTSGGYLMIPEKEAVLIAVEPK